MKNIITFINKDDHSIKVCLDTNIDIVDFDRKINNIQSNKYLDRLKQQYISQVLAKNPDVIRTESTIYMAMRLFCLDCELVSFIDIESMEYEVNSELNQSF